MKAVAVIDAEPTWESLLDDLLRGATWATTDETTEVDPSCVHYTELRKMARAADAYRQLQKSGALSVNWKAAFDELWEDVANEQGVAMSESDRRHIIASHTK